MSTAPTLPGLNMGNDEKEALNSALLRALAIGGQGGNIDFSPADSMDGVYPIISVGSVTVGTGTSGTATLSGGTVTVTNSAVKAASRIFTARNTTGGTAGHLNAPVGSITPGVSFVINSSSGTDTSTVNWWIVN